MDSKQKFDMDFDDADMEYVVNRIDPAFWDVELDGVEQSREDFLRKLKIIINDCIADKQKEVYMILDYQRFFLDISGMNLNEPTRKAIIHSLDECCYLKEKDEGKKGITKEEFIALIRAIPLMGENSSEIDQYYDAVNKLGDAYQRGYLNAKMEALNERLSSDSQDYKDEFLAIVNDMYFLS